jgi:hypothetical protein
MSRRASQLSFEYSSHPNLFACKAGFGALPGGMWNRHLPCLSELVADNMLPESADHREAFLEMTDHPSLKAPPCLDIRSYAASLMCAREEVPVVVLAMLAIPFICSRETPKASNVCGVKVESISWPPTRL